MDFFSILLVHLKVGSPRVFSFPVKDHLQLGKDLDLIDFDSAAEVFFYFGATKFGLSLWSSRVVNSVIYVLVELPVSWQ